jgi:hypothetical protein
VQQAWLIMSRGIACCHCACVVWLHGKTMGLQQVFLKSEACLQLYASPRHTLNVLTFGYVYSGDVCICRPSMRMAAGSR